MIWATDIITALGKGDILGTAALSAAATSLLPKSLNVTGFHLVADGLVDDLDTHIEDSDSVMAEPLDTLQFLNNDHLIV